MAEATVTLPSGEAIDVTDFQEFYHYGQVAEKLPLFDRGMENYLREKIGQDWSLIIRLENDLLLQEKSKDEDWDAVSHYKIEFLGMDKGCYSFKVSRIIPCPNDPGIWEDTFRLQPVPSYNAISSKREIH